MPRCKLICRYDPLLYNIPESKIWGGWDVEKFDTVNGGIREFVGLGPKSYGLKAANGANYIKVKGLSLKHAHKDVLNFEVMKQIVEEHLATGTTSIIDIPQMGFTYRFGQAMTTAYYIKKFVFQPEQLKGELRGAILYPYGHQ